VPDAFLTLLDQAMRVRIWNKFSTDMGITNMNTDSAIWTKGIALRKISEKRGKDNMEFFNIFRDTTAYSWRRNSTVAARRGFQFIDTSGSASLVVTVPVDLTYNVWFWSKDRNKLNTVSERFLFWQQQNPNLDLYLNGTYPLEIDLGFGEIVDESEIDAQYYKGEYFVIRCPIKLESWIFQSEADSDGIIKTIFLKGYDNSQEYDVEIFSDTIRGKMPSDSGEGTEAVTKTEE